MNTTLHPDLPIIIVDDEVSVSRAVSRTLQTNGYNNLVCLSDSSEVVGQLQESDASMVLLDITMPHIQGDELLVDIVLRFPNLPVIMATARDSAEIVVDCMKKGAFDFITKPLGTRRLLAAISGALQVRELRRENEALRDRDRQGAPHQPAYFKEIITQNSKMHRIFKYIEAIAPSSQVVLVCGETGVGKELVASAIHRASGRKGTFVAMNVAGVDDEVFSDTLFGHVKGAFTGAGSGRDGQIKKAAAGSLFLDEIGDLSLKSQIKLLRLLQEKVYQPLGADSDRKSDARIIVATNKNLDKMVEKGTFRKDLYYRIYAHHVALPPLRERLDDLPLLVSHFVDQASSDLGKGKIGIPGELYPLLRNYEFFGNIRELQSIIYDVVSLQSGHILALDLFVKKMIKKKKAGKSSEQSTGRVIFGPVLPTVTEARHFLVHEALKRSNGNISLAAKLIGLSRQSLSQYMLQHKIKSPAGTSKKKQHHR